MLSAPADGWRLFGFTAPYRQAAFPQRSQASPHGTTWARRSHDRVMALNDPDLAAAGPRAETASEEDSREAGRDIVVIGASAGGIHALQRLLAAMPSSYRGAVFVVVHLSPEARSELAAILSRVGSLPAVPAEDEMPIQHGRVHVAPPDCHLLVERKRMRVVRGPRENRHRPAIDPLFRSAAWAYGPRVAGVVLTGNLDDGTAGLWAIKSCGGTTIVQEPAEAERPEMPLNALMHNRIDYRLPLEDIAALLVRLLHKPAPVDEPQQQPSPTIGDEIEFAKMNRDIRNAERLGTLSPFTCPSCRGALWEMEEGGHLRYRCHTGHAYSHASLMVEQDIAAEESLYTALRAVEEKAAALRRLAERWPEHLPSVKQDYENRARELDTAADTLRAMLAGS